MKKLDITKPLTIMSGLEIKKKNTINWSDPVACFGSDHVHSTTMQHMHLVQDTCFKGRRS